MVATLDPPRNTNRHRRRSAHDGEFTEILTFSLLGLALSLLAIGQGWLGPVEYATSLLLLLGSAGVHSTIRPCGGEGAGILFFGKPNSGECDDR